jgi:pyruvate carboxylase
MLGLEHRRLSSTKGIIPGILIILTLRGAGTIATSITTGIIAPFLKENTAGIFMEGVLTMQGMNTIEAIADAVRTVRRATDVITKTIIIPIKDAGIPCVF